MFNNPFWHMRICGKHHPTIHNVACNWLRFLFYFCHADCIPFIDAWPFNTRTQNNNKNIQSSCWSFHKLFCWVWTKLNNQAIFAFQILKARLPGSTQHDQDVATISVIATIAVVATITVITTIAVNARSHHIWSILKLMQGGVKKRRSVKGRGVLDPITAIAAVAAMATSPCQVVETIKGTIARKKKWEKSGV